MFRIPARTVTIRSGGTALSLFVGGWILSAMVGCADHRIPLHTFLQMQEEAKAERATSQPCEPKRTASQPVLEKVIDDALGPYRVGPGDVFSVTFAMTTAERLPPEMQVRVDDEGFIKVPPNEKVAVSGLKLSEIEEAIRSVYVPDLLQDAIVHVEIVQPKSTEVLVVGAVTEPGLVMLRRDQRNLLFAIVGAGGVSELASGEVTLERLRKPDHEVTLKLTDPAELRASLMLPPLETGDILRVHAATPNTIFVGGLVNAPSPQSYPSGVQMTVLQALAAAGGLRTDVTPREATLVRRMEDGEDIHVRLDLDRLKTGKDPNIRLAAGDILWVPDTLETRIQDWVNRNIFFRAGVSANVNYSVSGVEFLNRPGQQAGGTGGGGGLEQSFDPFGFLNRNTSLRGITTSIPRATQP